MNAVAATVARVHRGVTALCAAEALFLGLGALGATLAAATLSGGGLERVSSWIVSAACALLVAVAAQRALGTSARDTARRLDRSLGFEGALVTAFEVEPGTGVARLLVERVAERLSVRRAARVAQRLSPLPIAAPFAAAALLGFARDAVAPPPADPAASELTGAAGRALARSGELSFAALEAGRAEELGTTPLEVPAELARLARDAARLGEALSAEGTAPVAAGELAGLERRLRELRREVAPTSGVAEALRRAETALDALRMRLGGGAQVAEGDGASSASGSGHGQPGEPEDPGQPGEPADGGPPPEPGAGERAAAAHGGWDAEYEAVVSGWVARRRARMEGS